MKPATYMKENVVIGRVALRISDHDARVQKLYTLDIRTNTLGNAMHTQAWRFKLVPMGTATKGTDPFPIGGIPCTFGYDSDKEAWDKKQRTALTTQLTHLLS